MVAGSGIGRRERVIVVFVDVIDFRRGDSFDDLRFRQHAERRRVGERVVFFVLVVVGVGRGRRVRDGERGEVDDRRFDGIRRSDFGARDRRLKLVERGNAQERAVFQGFKTQVARRVLFFGESFTQRGSVTEGIKKFHSWVSENSILARCANRSIQMERTTNRDRSRRRRRRNCGKRVVDVVV